MTAEKIKLRALTQSDLELTLQWNNQPDIRDTYAGHPYPVNREKEQAWYNRVLTSDASLNVFGIELTASQKLIGLTMLKNVNFINREAEWAIYIGDAEERGKGYAKEAMIQTLRWGFHQLGLNRIFLKVETQNINAIGMYKKAGFVEEGILRNCVFKNNEYRSQMILSMLQDEFKL
jgi:RimJ/RimL family protein N-acetyltransferase